MYKLLATSALVAAGMWASADAAMAQAKVAPISVVVGGYHEQTFGFATQKDNVNYGGNLGTGNNKVSRFSQQSDSEIFFGGRTTLANGITVGFDVQLEANTAGDQIDESYLFVDGAFGRLVLGSENSVDYIMNYSAPQAGRAFGAQESGGFSYIARPANVTVLDTPASGKGSGGGGTVLPGGGNDQQRVSYFTPRMAGVQVGVSFTPNVGGGTGLTSGGSFEDLNGFLDTKTWRTNGMHGAINYVNNFSGFDLRISAGASSYGKLNGATTAPGKNSILDYSVGFQAGASGFMVGAGYRKLDAEGGAEDGTAMNVGVTYTTGPFSIGLSYHTSEVEGSTANTAQDTFKQLLLSAAYTMGPGVDLIGSVINMKFEDETKTAINANSGTAVIGGIRLTF